MATASSPTVGPGVDLYANQRSRLEGSMIFLIILPTVFVGLRLASRKVSGAGYWWDDLFILLALFFSYGLTVDILISTTKYGLGRHVYILPEDSTRRFMQMLYAFEMLFFLTTCFNKLSILAFYRRIFPISQLRIFLIATRIVVCCFTLIGLLMVVFQCRPIHTFWDFEERFTPGLSSCINVDLFFLVTGGINCGLDFFIVLIPIPLLWRLRTTRSQKAVLTSIFGVAGFVCVVSIVRLVVLSRLTDGDLTWNYVTSAIWTAVEPTVGVASACLPSLRPLVKRVFRGTYKGPNFRSLATKPTQTFGSQDLTNNGRSPSRNVNNLIWSRNGDRNGSGSSRSGAISRGSNDQDDWQSFTRLEELDAPWGHNVHVQGGHDPRDSFLHPEKMMSSSTHERTGERDATNVEEMQMPRRIRVKTEVTLISTQRLDYRDHLF